MARKVQEIALIYDRDRVAFDNAGDGSEVTSIAMCRDPKTMEKVTVKVTHKKDELVSGLSYRFYGYSTKHPKYGDQFVAQAFVPTQPHGRTGIITYLSQANWIGKAIARKLWDKFGSQAVEIVREQPEVAVAAIGGGLNSERAQEAASFFEKKQWTEQISIDLMDLLAGRRFPKDLAKRLIDRFHNRAHILVEKNPYLLLREHGCGFLLCDQLYLDLGKEPGRLKRQSLCACYLMHSDRTGHTWHQPTVIEKRMRESISGTSVRAVEALKLAKRAKLITSRTDDQGKVWVAEQGNATEEGTVAAWVADWLDRTPTWPSPATLNLSQHQKSKFVQAFARPISIITGGGGTGKTHATAVVTEQLVKLYGHDAVAVCAPTGKAAVRITEVLQGIGVKLRAKTIHSLLKVDSSNGGWTFKHNSRSPLPHRFIVCDEFSMVSTSLAAALFQACKKSAHLLLVGDAGQLPPVGHGAPLRDLMQAGVPVGELTEIFRNSGQIIESCAMIRAGEKFIVNRKLCPEAGFNLKVLPATNGAAAIERIIETISTIGRRKLFDPVRDCQIIVAVNKTSALSRKLINSKLQNALNPNGKSVLGNPFRVDDKIVCLRNGFYPIAKNAPTGFNEEENQAGRVFVANGEQGYVKAVEPKYTITQLEAPARLVIIPRGGDGDTDSESDAGCQWDLAYAISCHKSQGSQWPVIFVALDEYPGARMICDRSWLYTAISRSQQVCFLVGKQTIAQEMVARNSIGKRKTFLVERIKECVLGRQ